MNREQSHKQMILDLVSSFIKKKHRNRKWTPGKDWVQYSGPYFSDREYISAVNTLLNEWLVLGSDAIKFEKVFPPLLGKKYGIVTNSGSSANLLMWSTIFSPLYQRKKYHTVIAPVAGFPTTVNPIIQLGCLPKWVDIELDTLNIDLDQVEEEAKNGSKYITFAHVLGNPPNMDRLMDIVNEYDLILLEDCCDALGSTYDGKLLGSFGRMASCSFYPAHHITMGEGGFVACDTKEEEKVLRSFREWGRGCFRRGTPINIKEKSKYIENIRPGDMVITHNGNQKRVSRIISKLYSGKYYTFNLKLKGNVGSTDYHPHLILKMGATEPEWIEAKYIEIGDAFLEKVPRENKEEQYFEWSYDTLYNIKYQKLKVEPDLMRLIGYWLAEGSLAKGLKGKWKYSRGNVYYSYRVDFSFNKNEKDYINDVNHLMHKYFGVTGFPGKKSFKGNSKNISFKSRAAYELFLQYFGTMAYNKSLPENMVNWKSELTSELVNGLWRGDGSYCDENKSFSISITSYTLLEQIRRILLKHGIITSYFVSKKENRQNIKMKDGTIIHAKHDLYNIVSYGLNAERFSEKITQDPIQSRTNILYAKIENGYALYPVRKISIENINEMVYNMEVDDDNSYHAWGIATHNCYCVGKKANLSPIGTCGCRFKNWLPSLPDEIFDHKYVYEQIGYNLKPIEIQCSMGLVQLEKLPEIHAKRKENHKRLAQIFAPYEEFFHIHKATEKADVSWFAFPITIRTGAPFKRSKFTTYLESKKIQTRNYFGGNLLLQPAYQDLFLPGKGTQFPVATKVTTDTLFLGTSPVITPEQLDYVEEIVTDFFNPSTL